ncbi:MAG: DUF362 domain-containing protein [Bryobacteraceae bacterium]|jgi:uncharacterized protein (DUF362 family)
MHANYTRRDWLKLSALGGACLAGMPPLRAAAPAGPVAVAKCKTYEPAELMPAMAKLFDQLGGLGRLVNGKTVAIKINLTGAATYRLGYLPAADTHLTNPAVVAAAVSLIAKAGAKRIRVVESVYASSDPVEEFFYQTDMDPRVILSAAPNVEFENTNFTGNAKKYSRLTVPSGGYIYPGFDLNHAYEDCDVFVSVAKLKEHATAGFTGSMKNCFGMAPATIYGSGAGVDEPAAQPHGSRTMFHTGNREPAKTAPQEKDFTTPRQEGYRVPRIVVDLVGARPIHLAVVEGVKSMAGGEGPWIREALAPVHPGVILAGLNPVNTDAVALAVMGFDPMGERGSPPFEGCDSTLKLAEDAGIGARDLKRIEVVGAPIREALFDFAALRRQRRAAQAGRG